MQGRISSWIKDQVGLDPINLYPSVRCGLEGALLTALAHAHRLPLTDLLLRHQSPASQSVGADMPVKTVLVNGLLDSNSNVEACQQEAIHMVAQGFTALKIKVWLIVNLCIACIDSQQIWSNGAALCTASLLLGTNNQHVFQALF